MISLFRLNTHFCVLMDSDKKSKGARLGASKLRIIEECKKSGSMSWVTWGSTIENYVPADILDSALNEVYPSKKWNCDLGNRYVCPLNFNFAGRKFGPNKIAVAKAVRKYDYEPMGDAAKQVNKLCTAICLANGIE